MDNQLTQVMIITTLEEFEYLSNSDDEGDTNSKIEYPIYNPRSCFGQVHLKVGMEFDTIKMFIKAARNYTIFHGRDLKWVKVDTIRARAHCKQIECPWEKFCSWSEVIRSFQIKTFLEEHICGKVLKNKQATMKWVAKRGADKLRVHPNLNHVEAHEHIREHYGVYIDERKMFKTIKEARSLVEGSIQLQYAKLWDYSHDLTRSNEGSTVKMNCIPIPRSSPQFH